MGNPGKGDGKTTTRILRQPPAPDGPRGCSTVRGGGAVRSGSGRGTLSGTRGCQSLFDRLIRAQQHRFRNGQPERLGALQDAVDVGGGLAVHFDLSRAVVSKTHKLIYNTLGELPYWPVDFYKLEFWEELVAMHKAGKLDPKFEKLYFTPTRPMFELYDLVNDPSELTNLAGTPQAEAVETKLKSEMHEWMMLQRDFIPLPVIAKKSGKGKEE